MTTTKKISELPSAVTPLAGDEIMPIVQDGATRRATIDEIREGLADEVHTHTLSDIADAGTAAGADTDDFATAAQGALADTALQPDDVGSAEIVEGYCIVENIKIVGGASALFLAGKVSPCVKNVIENVTIWDAQIGVTLDGWNDTNKPCYWNNISRVLVARPKINGVLLTTTPTDWEDPETFGDSPNANKFYDVRVYSLSSPLSGSGFFVSTGQYNNSFVDCEANVHEDAEACFRLGFLARSNIINNFYAECLGLAPGIRIDNGSYACCR